MSTYKAISHHFVSRNLKCFLFYFTTFVGVGKATVGMFDNSYFDNSKSQKTDYVRHLEGLVFDKKYLYYRERERDTDLT